MVRVGRIVEMGVHVLEGSAHGGPVVDGLPHGGRRVASLAAFSEACSSTSPAATSGLAKRSNSAATCRRGWG